MARTRIFDALTSLARTAFFADRHGVSTPEARERVAEIAHRSAARRVGRRAFLGGIGAATATTAGAFAFAGSQPKAGPRIAIIGAGMAGLVCADQLARRGYVATIYEANTRIGGRLKSTRVFPGQVAELGGELIDTPHKTVLGYAQALGLAKEDLEKLPGETVYNFFGANHDEVDLVDEYRELVKRMRPDFQQLSAPTFYDHTPEEAALDAIDLATYLDGLAGDLPLAREMLKVAYTIEYGVEPEEQSCLAMLQFIHLDGRRHFAEFGVFSDERYHLVGGNDELAKGIAAGLPGTIVTGARLSRLTKNGFGEYEIYFAGASAPEIADAVVLAVPFSALRPPYVDLDPSLGLSADKRRVIAELPYGSNVKTMIGFEGQPWRALGCNGMVYSDRPNLQNTWETNPSAAGPTSILTDFSGGRRSRQLELGDPPAAPLGCNTCHGSGPAFFDIKDGKIQQQIDAFLGDLDQALPGTKAAASQSFGKYVFARGHWTPQRYSRGSYTANPPGYFTTMAGLEGESAGALKFAGEHTNSFYEWQGFIEGAALSGVAAAEELLGDIRAGRL